MAELLPLVLAGLGGGAIAVAVAEFAGAIPAVADYLASARAALTRAGSEGRPPTAQERRRLTVLVGSALALAGLLAFGSLVALAAAICGPLVVGSALDRRHRSYRERVEAGLPAVAASLADALAAGGSLRGALMSAAVVADGPAAVELARVRADLAVGLPPREALAALADRVGSEEVSELTAALVAEGSGGDLAGLLKTQVAGAGARRRARRKAEAATAQARATGAMVVAMPFAAALLVELAAPGFAASLLADPVAASLLAAAVGLQAIAYLWIQRLGRVRT